VSRARSVAGWLYTAFHEWLAFGFEEPAVEPQALDLSDAEVEALRVRGPSTSVHCAAEPSDVLRFRTSKDPRDGVTLLVQVECQGDLGTVALTPTDARAVAVGMLNAVDEAQGIAPLLFVPDCPHCSHCRSGEPE
jgi:hypothetical protein